LLFEEPIFERISERILIISLKFISSKKENTANETDRKYLD
jgi:hypothetical protein